jgi:GNAT superfamily N-acetyltransferase
MDKGEFNRWLFEVMNTVTLVVERRGRILGFFYATLEETSARIVFLAVLPEYRRRGIGTALHQELKSHIPREVAFVGGYALLDRPVVPFSKRLDTSPVSSASGWTATRDLKQGGRRQFWSPCFATSATGLRRRVAVLIDVHLLIVLRW